MKWMQRWISWVLCVAMVSSMMPVTAFAEQDAPLDDIILDVDADEVSKADAIEVVPEAIDDEVLLLSTEIVASGYCGGEGDGTNLSWALDSTGTLTILGTGAMANFYAWKRPWLNYIQDIKKVTIGVGVTSIGEYAFEDCESLTSVVIPDSITSIGESAFWRCISLTSVDIPNSVPYIDYRVFEGCKSLTSVVIPAGVTGVAEYAFHGCVNLTSIVIPNSVKSIDQAAFSDCTNLENVYIV